MSECLLVTVLGKSPRSATYALEGVETTADLATLALIRLLPEKQRPSRVLAFCTPESRESWLILEQGCKSHSIESDCVEIAGEPSNAAEFLRTVTSSIPSDTRGLMVDLTHGPRHYALLNYVALQYLAVLRHLPFVGAYYLWFDECVGRFVDLLPLRRLYEWIHAILTFDEAGDASGLARLIERCDNQVARAMARELRGISRAREVGLPLELGQVSASFRIERTKPFKRVMAGQGALLEDELWRRLEEPLRRFGFRNCSKQSQGWKKSVVLSAEELTRQAGLVDDLLDRGSIAVALGLMREWTVSRVVLQIGDQDSWLDRDSARKGAETALHALDAFAQEPSLAEGLTSDQQRLGRFWHELSELRNAFHHHGMRPRVMVGTSVSDVEKRIRAVQTYWASLKMVAELPMVIGATIRRLLVSSVGRRPGVLYSAIEACRREKVTPEACLLLVSDETSNAVDAAIHAAEFDGQVLQIRISDPFGAHAEIDALVRSARRYLAVAQELLVNLTGGTTLMGLAVAAIVDEARRLGRDTRRFGLIDRRPPNEQDAEPYYRAGEAFWLDTRSSYGD